MTSLTPTLHAVCGASKADRWIACPPSARFEEQIESEASFYADEGTLAHNMAALITSSRVGIFKGTQPLFNSMLDEFRAEILAFYISADYLDPETEYFDMLTHAEGWAQFIRSMGGDITLEGQVDFSEYVPQGFGTCDAANKTPDVLYISDYKFGAGKKVSAVDNSQLKLYALGKLLEILKTEPTYWPATIVLSVYQPRIAGSDNPASSWETAPEELFQWAVDVVRPAAALAMGGQGVFNPGDHCGFCSAKTVCRAYYLKFAKLLKIRDKREMTDEEIGHVLRYGASIGTWVKKVQADALRRFETKRPIAGYKMVAGGKVRKFKSEAIVVDVLLGEGWDSEEIYNSDLRPLTEIEKKLGVKRFAELFDPHINKVPYANTIAPEADERQGISALGAEEFDD